MNYQFPTLLHLYYLYLLLGLGQLQCNTNKTGTPSSWNINSSTLLTPLLLPSWEINECGTNLARILALRSPFFICFFWWKLGFLKNLNVWSFSPHKDKNLSNTYIILKSTSVCRGIFIKWSKKNNWVYDHIGRASFIIPYNLLENCPHVFVDSHIKTFVVNFWIFELGKCWYIINKSGGV